MRNVDDNRAAEEPRPDSSNGLYSSRAARRPHRRKQLMVGAAGLAAILGAGAVVTHQLRDTGSTTVAEPDALAPIASDPPVARPDPAVEPSPTPPSATVSSPSVAPTTPPRAAAPTTASLAPIPTSSSERVRKAREAAAKGGVPVQRPLPEPTAAAAAVDVTEVSVPTASGMLKVVSARSDLTGMRELAWVVDEGEPVGKARCTSKVRLSPDAPAKDRPTLLLCWNVSATKSAFSIAADPAGPPSKKASVAAIDAALAKLS